MYVPWDQEIQHRYLLEVQVNPFVHAHPFGKHIHLSSHTLLIM